MNWSTPFYAASAGRLSATAGQGRGDDVVPGVQRATIEVGQIRVLSYVGEHYIEAEVVKGEVKPGDIAKKDTVACLIQPAK